MLCLEEVCLDEGHRQPQICRLVERRLEGTAWSQPKVLFQDAAWYPQSLAAARFQIGDVEYVLAIWRGEHGCLTYTVQSPSRAWSEPVTMKVVIGRENWVVSHQDRFTLVTKTNGNLLWCHFTLLGDVDDEGE